MKKLSEYAKEHGIHYQTAYIHFKKGLISRAYQLPTGTIYSFVSQSVIKSSNL